MNTSTIETTSSFVYDLINIIFPFPLVADVLLMLAFLIKIYYLKNSTMFGNKKTTSVLDGMYVAMLFVLILQGVLCLCMFKIHSSVADGLVCSIENFLFHLLLLVLKVLLCSILFQLHYIWVKQKMLSYLNSSRFINQVEKLVFIFTLSVCVIISFKANIDVAFILKDGICLGKKLKIHTILTKMSRISALSVFILLVLVKIYYLYRTKKENITCLKQSMSSNSTINLQKKIDIVFGLACKQIISFIKLLLSLLTLFILNFLLIRCLKLEPSQDLVEFSILNYFCQHIYMFLCCLILCVFRFVASKLSIRKEYFQIKNKFVDNSLS